MMFSYRLVRLIESHADALAAGLEEKVRASSKVMHFRDISSDELRTRVYEIYRHLGEWLLGKNELDIEQRYREIGARRARQKVPLSEVIQAIVLVKENLWDFLKSEAVMDRAIEIMGELELLQMLEMFFDRAIYYAAVGHEEQVGRETREAGALRAS
jgi:Ni,Fe-hydrogenase III large subunit